MTSMWLTRLSVILLGMLIPTLLGCGASRTPLTAPQGVPWPPPEGAIHAASDDAVMQLGDKAVSFGGGANITGTNLKLPYTPGDITYGIWSLGGFSPTISLTQVKLYIKWHPDPPAVNTVMFIGLSNYAKGYWEWYEVTDAEEAADEWVHTFAVDDDYLHNGSFSVAAIITGTGIAYIEAVEFSRQFDSTVPVPQNLHMTDTNIGSISLDWDDVPDVTGYNLYRSTYVDFRTPVLVAGSPFGQSQCTDLTGIQGMMMYYKVTALRGTAESAFSEMVDIFCPEEDLILPSNIQFGEITPTSIEITWDWGPGNPEYWVLYWKSYKDFDLRDEGVPYMATKYGWSRNYTFTGLSPDTLYYFRIAAAVSVSSIGRMTDDAPLSTEGLWQWEPDPTGFAASEPISAVVVDGDLTVSYFEIPPDHNVDVARREGGVWTSYDTPLDSSIDSGGGLATNQVLAYSSGTYLVAARTLNSDDVWATTGVPGNWDAAERIHGDGSTAPGHPYSGLGMKAAANDSEFSLVHFYGQEDNDRVLLQQLPSSGGSWTTEDILSINNINVLLSPAYNGSTLGVMFKSDNGGAPGIESTEVYFGTSADSFTWAPITPQDGTDWGMSCMLNVMSGHWIGMVMSLADNDPFFFTHDGSDWTYSPLVVTPGVNDGRHSQIVVDGTNAYALHWAPPNNWQFAVFEGGVWTQKPFAFTNALGLDPQLVVLGGSPYIVYVDANDNTLKVALGTPPA